MATLYRAILSGLPLINELVNYVVLRTEDIERVNCLHSQITPLIATDIVVGEG